MLRKKYKHYIDNKEEFDVIFCHVLSVINSTDDETAVVFCDYIIDILLKNMESCMQLNFIYHEKSISGLFSKKKGKEPGYKTFPYMPKSLKVNGNYINSETDRLVDVDLKNCYLLCNTQKTESLIKTIKILMKKDFAFDRCNHLAMYISYINACAFLSEGVHSLSVAHYMKKGAIKAKLIDLPVIFPYVSTDGLNWYIQDDYHSVVPADDYRLSLIYEIAKAKYNIENKSRVRHDAAPQPQKKEKM